MVLVGLLAGTGVVLAQKTEENTPLSAIRYWESKPPSRVRDTTLIRLYSRNAERIADLDSSLFWLQKGFKTAFRIRSNPWLAFTYNRIGSVYLRKGVSFQAIEYLFKGLQYAELAQDVEQQALGWDLIGDCYANLKNYGRAIQAEKRAIELFEKSGNRPARAKALVDLGAVYRQNGQLDESIKALEASLPADEPVEESATTLIEAYFNLAATFLEKEDFANAEKYGLLAAETEISVKGRANAELLSLISLTYSRFDKPKAAEDFAARAEYYLIYEWPVTRERTAHHLFEAYKALQKPEEALLWHEKFVKLRETNQADAQSKRVELLRYEYDAQQRDARMQDMADDMAREGYLRNALILGVLVFLTLAVALARSNRLLQKRRQELDQSNRQLTEVGELLQETNTNLEVRIADATNELREANRTLTRKNHEIQEALFRGQSLERERVASELHNNLGSLLTGVKWRLEAVELDNFSAAEREKYQSVVGLITDAYNQVRHISHNLLPSILEKEGLVAALEKLISDLNRSGRASFEMIRAEGMVIEDKKTSFELYSCVLELLNNILKHADARQVVLELVQTEGFHVVVVSDDGIGIGPRRGAASGKGLEIIRQRVASLHGTFSIRPLKNKKGTSVTLRVPRQRQAADA